MKRIKSYDCALKVLRLGAIVLLLATAVTARADYATVFDDGRDFYNSMVQGLGLSAWRVSEPFITLWIQYSVLRYQTSAGRTVALDIAYRQRGALAPTNAFSFGPGWQ